MLLKKFLVALLLAGSLVIAGCGGGGGSDDDTNPEVYFVNGSSDSIGLDFLMDQVVDTANAAYLGGSGGWKRYEFRGDDVQGYDVAVRASDTGFEFDRIAQVFQRDTSTAILAIGQRTIAPGEDLKRLRTVAFNINRVRPNGNKCRLVFVHAFNRFTGFSTPAIVMKNPGDTPQYQTGIINYGTSSVLETDSGTFTFQARRADGEAIYATATENLVAGSVYLVMVTGVESDSDPNRRPRITFISLPTEN